MQTHVPDPVEFNKALEKAFADFNEGNFDAAEPVLKSALPALAQDNDASAQCLDKLIEISTARGQYGDAIRQNLRLLSILKSKFGEFDQSVRVRLHKLAGLYENVGRLDEAEYMHTRAAMLKDYLVEAKLTKEQEAIGKIGDKDSEKPEEDLGPEPDWLAQAFAEADQYYGKATAKPEKASLAIEIQKEIPTGHFFRPTMPEVKEGSKLRDITDFGQQASQPAQSQAPAPQVKTDYCNLRIPPKEKNVSSIVPVPLKDEITYLEEDVSSARLKRFDEPVTPQSETNWSFLQKMVEHRLKESPLPQFRENEEREETSYDGDRNTGGKPARTEVYRAKSGRTEKTSGKPSDLPADGEDAQTTFKDIVWRLGKLFKPFIQRAGGLGTVGDIRTEGAQIDHRGLTRKVPTKRTVRKSLEITLPPAQENVLARDVIHKFLAILDKAKQKDNILQAIFGTVIFCLALLCLADRFIPRRIAAADVFSQMPMAYRTAAGDIQLRLIDPSSAQLSSDTISARVPCNMFLGDWRDCLNISFSALIQKQHWLMRTDEGFKSDEGPLLYCSGGPELQIADHMENLANIAASLYSGTGVYPMSIGDFPRGRLAYANPFTKETVRPVVERLYFETDKDPLKRVPALSEGASLPDESGIGPGSIHCYSVTIQTPEPAKSMFYVRGYDRNGAPLIGSSLGTNYFLALKDGHWIRHDDTLPSFLKWSPRKQTFWLIDGTTDGITLFILSQGGAYFFAAMCLLLILIKKAVKPVKATKRILNFLIPTSGALSVLYAFARFLP
jgi:hypothetical protein